MTSLPVWASLLSFKVRAGGLFSVEGTFVVGSV